MTDEFNLRRFLSAQSAEFECALNQLRHGRKTGHWMWFIFPQLAGLGSSKDSMTYSIKSLREAKAYLCHPVLGPRLRKCVEIMINSHVATADEVFGNLDTKKFHSSLTLFALASGDESIFAKAIEKYFRADLDVATLRLLGLDTVQ